MDFMALAQECVPWVAPTTMARIVKVESSFNPYAIGIVGGRLAKQPRSKSEGIQAAKWLLGNGYKIAMGLGQIYYKELPGLGYTVEDAFDPCKNLAGSGRLLASKYAAAKKKYPNNEQQALRAAFSHYNTGNFNAGWKNGYVSQVVSVRFK